MRFNASASDAVPYPVYKLRFAVASTIARSSGDKDNADPNSWICLDTASYVNATSSEHEQAFKDVSRTLDTAPC